MIHPSCKEQVATEQQEMNMGQKEFWDSILKDEGMPANLEIGVHIDIDEIEPGTSLGDALHDALSDIGMLAEDFLMAAERDPAGLQVWIESWAGPLN
jgi:hypothetical protein